MEKSGREPYFLMCERRWVFHVLIVVAGIFGADTYLLRGNVVCNAPMAFAPCPIVFKLPKSFVNLSKFF